MDLSRRQFARLSGAAVIAGFAPTAAGAQAGAALPTSIGGVNVGVCLYNFRDLPRPSDDAAYMALFVDACRQVGVGLLEINATYLEPVHRLPFAGIPRLWDAPLTGRQREVFEGMTAAEVAAERERLRQWRLSTPPNHFRAVADTFRAGGLQPFSYVMTFTPDMTEAEIDAIFRQAQTLGVTVFSTNQTKVELAPQLAPFAERYGMDLGFHNHAATQNPNEVASRDSFERLFSVSPRMKANFDVGHYTASDQDVMEFVRTHFDRITHFHMKDRKRSLGPGTRWGEGDAPLAEVLQYIRERGSATPAIIEYEYPGAGGIAETVRCLDFIRQTLA